MSLNAVLNGSLVVFIKVAILIRLIGYRWDELLEYSLKFCDLRLCLSQHKVNTFLKLGLLQKQVFA